MKGQRVLVTGGYGFLGDAVALELTRRKHRVDRFHHSEYDLVNFVDAVDMINDTSPEIVIHLAANVGGIEKNVEHPGTLFYDNMRMGLNLLEAIRRYDTNTNVVLVGTACSYPDAAPIPTPETALWTGGRPALDTRAYAVAKLALFEMAHAYQREWPGFRFSCIIPSNLYGPYDNFHSKDGHVIPALITRFAAAKADGGTVKIHGDGLATRDFLYVDDAARGIVDAAEHPYAAPINLGSGREISIQYVVKLLGEAFDVEYEFTNKGPVGVARRLLDISEARERWGWEPEVKFEDGLAYTLRKYRNLEA
jgi:GDP-L-fucose synthase